MSFDVDALLAELDLDAKASLLAGQDVWSLPALPRIGLGSLVLSDGPVGVPGGRGSRPGGAVEPGRPLGAAPQPDGPRRELGPAPGRARRPAARAGSPPQGR